MRSLFSILFLFSFFISQAQVQMKRYKTTDKDAPVCHVSHVPNRHVVPRAATPRNMPKNPVEFIIDFDEEVPESARAEIRYAAEILSEGLSSTIPIHLKIVWGDRTTNSGSLAFARPSEYIINFPNSREKVAYPIPLAEKLAGVPINADSEPDIIVTVNRNARWYYGLNNTGEIGDDQYDLVTVMLHEVVHGLGFTGFAGIAPDGVTGFMKYNFDTERYDKDGTPVIFNLYKTNGAGRNLCRTYEDQTTRLGNALLSNNVYIQTPQYEVGTAPRLFAPTDYQPGSSFHHLNSTTYNNTNDDLMTPTATPGGITHDLGISLNILQDLGWASTHLRHQGVEFEEDLNKPLVITANVDSDLGYDPNSVTLYVSQDSFKTVETISMTPTSQADQYTHTIEATGNTAAYHYYFTVVDSRNITLPFPQEGPDPLFFSTFYGDSNLPVIDHSPLGAIDDQTTQFVVEAIATDFYKGIDSVYIEYTINGELQPTVRLNLDTTDNFRDSLYVGVVSLDASLSSTDVLLYRIVAVDKNSPGNIRYLPSEGRWPIEIKMTFDAVITYINDFDENRDDFDGNGFSISQPDRLESKGIQTEHPYENAGAERGSLDFIYQLNRPIILKERNALIEFDEIVLVEPGEDGTVFTDTEFWDYVIVEGRKRGEADWLPFLDGYDSREQSVWLSAFRRGQGATGGNSLAIGLPSLFRPKTIDMLQNGNFSPGEIVDVRFRLFSDPFTWGWGWAIDNLRIQEPTTAVEDYLHQQDFKLSPNPTNSSFVLIEANFKKAVDHIDLHIYDNVGRLLVKKSISSTNGQIKEAVEIGQLTSGIYFVSMRMDGVEQISRKIVVE